jgi:hypothetical protein
MILHYNGVSWQQVATPDLTPLTFISSISVVSQNDIWAAGSEEPSGYGVGLVAHWNGHAWSRVIQRASSMPVYFNSVTATPDGEVWVVGTSLKGAEHPFAEHYSGTTWTSHDFPDSRPGSGSQLYAVTGTSADGVWAGGTWQHGAGGMWHWDPQTQAWKEWDNRVGTVIGTMASSSPTNVWAAGPEGLPDPFFERWNGKHWRRVSTGAISTDSYLRNIIIAPTGNVWATDVVEHASGASAYVYAYENGRFVDTHFISYGAFDTFVPGIAAVPQSSDVWVVGAYLPTSDTQYPLAERFTCD